MLLGHSYLPGFSSLQLSGLLLSLFCILSHLESLFIDFSPFRHKILFGDEKIAERAIRLVSVEDALSTITHIDALETTLIIIRTVVGEHALYVVLGVVDIQREKI